MAIDAVEGKQKLSYMESRRKHLWQLLQMGMDSTSIPIAVVPGAESDQPRSVVSPIGTSELSEKLNENLILEEGFHSISFPSE